MKYTSSIFSIESLFRALVSISILGALWVNIDSQEISTLEVMFLIGLVSLLIYIFQFKSSSIKWLENKKLIDLLGLTVAALYVFWAIEYDSIQTGDFGVYWKCGTEFLLPINNWLEICHGAYLKNPLIYAMRSFFFNVPISWVTNNNYLLWKLTMAILHIASIFLTYKVISAMSGNLSGILAAFLLFINPEWTYLITTSSADNIVILLQIFSFYIFYKFLSIKVKNSFITFFPALVLVFFLAEWIRSIALFFLLAFIFASTQFTNKRLFFKKIFFLSSAFIAASFITSFIIHDLWSVKYQSPLNFVSNLAELDLTIFPPQNPQVSFEWMDHLWLAISPENRNEVGLHRFLDELLTQYSQYPKYYFQKIAILFSGTGNMDMLSKINPNNIDNIFTAPTNTLPSGALAHKISLYANIFILLVALVSAIFFQHTSYQKISLAFIAIFMLIMGGFGPLLSRYGLLIAFPLAVLGSSSQVNKYPTVDKYLSRLLRVIISSLLIISVYLLGQLASKIYINYYPRLILSLTQPEASNFKEIGPCNEIRVPIHLYFDRRIRSSLEKNVTCASYLFQIQPNTTNISFFITREKLPYPNEDIGTAIFEYKIRIGDKFSTWQSLDNLSSKWIDFKVDDNINNRPENIEIFVKKIAEENAIEFEIRDFLYR
jgi:hypothetical protein